MGYNRCCMDLYVTYWILCGCVSHSDILKTKMIIFNTSIVVTQMTYLDYKCVLKEKNCLKVIKSNLVNAKIPLLSTYCLKT